MAGPEVCITGAVVFAGKAVAVRCYFSALRPVDQVALDGYHASLPARALPTEPTDDERAEFVSVGARVTAALIGVFDASVRRIKFVTPDGTEGEIVSADLDGSLKSQVARALIDNMDARINEPGQSS